MLSNKSCTVVMFISLLNVIQAVYFNLYPCEMYFDQQHRIQVFSRDKQLQQDSLHIFKVVLFTVFKMFLVSEEIFFAQSLDV